MVLKTIKKVKTGHNNYLRRCKTVYEKLYFFKKKFKNLINISLLNVSEL